MRQNNILQVFYGDRQVGTLVLNADHKVAFEYTDTWLEEGFSISPFYLPLKRQVFVPVKNYFDGLFGVFSDSLPDAWGRLLLDRMLQKSGQNKDTLTVLDRLAIVGESGMGALTYRPQREMKYDIEPDNLDILAEQCCKILNTEYSEKLDELYALGGTSGGARPKIFTQVDGEDWIIKFPAHVDPIDVGKMEYDYACCAGKCGIIMTETRLFPSDKCKGYFGTKRYDRERKDGKIYRYHVITASALLEVSHEIPSLDYNELMKLTKILTKDRDVEQMYRRMCFNVYAHNRDDHSKNFSYIYDEEHARWELAPAYDLTYSNTYYGEHTTTVNGNGRNPGLADLVAVGEKAGMKKNICKEIAEQIEAMVHNMLGDYLKL